MQSAVTVLGVLRERGRRGLPLEELYRQMFNPQMYLLAYGRIYANHGAMTPGTTRETADGMSMSKISRIIGAMRRERYRFRPVRRVHIPKKNGKTRPLGMPSWSDKLVGEVVRLLLEAYYEPVFSDRSRGFRPGRGCHTALREVRAEARRPAVAAANDTAAHRQEQANATATAYRDTRPGLFAARASKRRWNEGREEHAQEVRQAAADAVAVRASLVVLDREIDAARRAERTASDALGKADAAVRSAERAITDARLRWGDRVPDGPEYGETERQELIEQRELSAPWADEEFSSARTRLFLAALALHKAFILNARPRIRPNLNAMMDILDGKGRPKDAAATLAARQTLFLVVPVLSTTFASVGKMFTGLGRESLGWLLVDEAGQTAPQNAAGALWRCRRAVIVGDPLQLEPIVTLPWGGQRALLEEFKVTPVWAPSRSSTQQLADRLAIVGTSLPGPAGEDVWVGAPLRVHRRCDRPMFEVSNTIAYNGLMVFGTPADREPFHGENAWIDIRSSVRGSNWIQAEGDMLREVLVGLRNNGGIQAAQIRVISPYRVVAENARKIFLRVFAGASRDDLDQWIGTVHKMQGREADAVILVLGGDPGKPGSRRFARETPNLLNVAVTRARRRLYVIGNHQTWGSERYFSALTDPAILKYHRPHSSTPRRPELPL